MSGRAYQALRKKPMPALRRQVAPEAPVLRPLALFVRRWPVGPRHQPARIHPFVEQVDDFALARAVHPAKQDDHRRPAGLAQPGLFIEQLGAQGRDLRLVFPARYLPAQFGGFKHCDILTRPAEPANPRTRDSYPIRQDLRRSPEIIQGLPLSADLLAFLHSLTDEALLQNPAFGPPR